jgi:glutamine synthetase adenylyltransferase
MLCQTRRELEHDKQYVDELVEKYAPGSREFDLWIAESAELSSRGESATLLQRHLQRVELRHQTISPLVQYEVQRVDSPGKDSIALPCQGSGGACDGVRRSSSILQQWI